MDQFQVWEGQIVPRTFKGGFVFLSYLVSYVGSWTTLELLDKRTAVRGSYNWYILIGSAISMGGVAIWCMYYIGNLSIILGDGDAQIQLTYNAGITTASFFVPVLVLLAAFFIIGSNEKVRQIRVILGGALAGLAVCSMHYVGQAAISNYDCVYNFQYIVGSAIIAVLASVIAFWVFFVMRAAWKNSWWKRALCANVLAGAVSGMHWLASVGTQYRYRHQQSITIGTARRTTIVFVIVLSIFGCIVLIALAMLAQQRRRRSANRAQQVVLACATFDSQGRLLVTSEGLLPSQKITNSYVERSFDDIFTISHPVFLWIFRTTRNWRGIAELIPGMRSHLQTTAARSGSGSTTQKSTPDPSNEDEGVEDYSVVFRELFCVAASELAEQINEPLENVGVLYDEIISTGTISKYGQDQKRGLFGYGEDLERAGPTPFVFGRGQVLFVVRRTNKSEAARLQASGFRFAGAQNVVDILARSMQVQRDELAAHIESMQRYSKGDHILNPGVHMACFAIRASVRGGFDVLVRRDAKNQLPTMQLPIASLEPWHREFLSQMENWTVFNCLNWLRSKTTFSSMAEQTFATQVFDTIVALADEIGDPFFHDALLTTNPYVLAPCRGFGDYPKPGRASLLAFRIIAPIHSRAPHGRLTYSPLSFFRTQQHVYRNMPDHDVFARKIHREFAPIVEPKKSLSYANERVRSPSLTATVSTLPPSSPTSMAFLVPTLHHPPRDGQKRPDIKSHRSWFGLSPTNSFLSEKKERKVASPPISHTDASSEKHLMDHAGNPFGGIMVSQEVSVDVREVGKENEVELSAMGTFGSAACEMDDPETFVDLLFEAAVEGR